MSSFLRSTNSAFFAGDTSSSPALAHTGDEIDERTPKQPEGGEATGEQQPPTATNQPVDQPTSSSTPGEWTRKTVDRRVISATNSEIHEQQTAAGGCPSGDAPRRGTKRHWMRTRSPYLLRPRPTKR